MFQKSVPEKKIENELKYYLEESQTNKIIVFTSTVKQTNYLKEKKMMDSEMNNMI